jgi:putative membrane protein
MPSLTSIRAGVFLRGAGLLTVCCTTAYAHGGEDPVPPAVWSSWSFEPGVVVPLILAAGAYGMGLCQLPARFRQEATWFYSGWLLLVVALVSPVHRLGGWLFSVHMTQHELLMIGAAPLLVLGRPGLVLLRSLPARTARKLANWGERSRLTAAWHRLTHPAVAWVVQAFALWSWHIPSWFEATLHHEWVHALQHASFLGTALWFWYSVFRGPRRVADYGWGVLNLFVTAVHSSVLGALITFAPRAWYESYVATAPAWGLTALEDQQLGGLVMWVPAGLVYILAALALLAGWLRGTRTPETGLATKAA